MYLCYFSTRQMALWPDKFTTIKGRTAPVEVANAAIKIDSIMYQNVILVQITVEILVIWYRNK